MSLLSLSSLKAYYGESQALFDVNLEVNEGEIVALMGRNGTGKSTTVKSIFQMIPTRGELLFSGKNLNNLKSFQISRLRKAGKQRAHFEGARCVRFYFRGDADRYACRRWY